MDSIIEKMRFQQFFILYENINFYKNIYNQKFFNYSTLLNYIVGYIYFIITNNYIEDSANN